MAEPLLSGPDNWVRGTLEPDRKAGLIIRVDSGGTPSTRDPDNWGGAIPWLTPKEITGREDGVLISRTERTITERGLRRSGARLLPPQTVMLTKRAPVGVVAINAVPVATNQGFMNFGCGPLLRPLYLAYWLRANRVYLNQVANGSTYPELYKTDLFEFEICVPPIDHQERILNVISALRYITLIGLPLEQSVTDPLQTLSMQEHRRRLSSLLDCMLPLLLSGTLDVSSVRADFLREVR